MDRAERIERLTAGWDRKRVRDEVVEKLLDGGKVSSSSDIRGVDLEHVLDGAINDNVSGFVRDQFELFAGVSSKNSDEVCERLQGWLKRKVESYVDRHESLLDEYIAEQAEAFEDDGDADSAYDDMRERMA